MINGYAVLFDVKSLLNFDVLREKVNITSPGVPSRLKTLEATGKNKHIPSQHLLTAFSLIVCEI